MNPAAELLTRIETAGGSLIATPDGYLKFSAVPPEFYESLKEHKPALIALLHERERPCAFVYQPRSQAQWERRIDQNYRSNHAFRPRLQTALPEVEADPLMENGGAGDESDTGEPHSKVTSTTLCVCGHARKDHHTAPEPHMSGGEFAFYCITSHCGVYSYKDGISAPCSCLHFRAQETDTPKLTRARVGDYDLCAACGHWKVSHCTKKKPGAASRLKVGELAYQILRGPGVAYGCKHFDPCDPACQCTSTSCSHTDDGKEFCGCEKFVNPWLTPKTRAAAKKRTPRNPVAASLAVAATLGTLESVLGGAPVKPRRSRKKKATAFTTGGELFPPETTTAPRTT